MKRESLSREPGLPDSKAELEFVSDSPEYLAYTIEYIGYRDKLEKAFQTAIIRAKSGQNNCSKHD